jgi:hypothetical protein
MWNTYGWQEWIGTLSGLVDEDAETRIMARRLNLPVPHPALTPLPSSNTPAPSSWL